MHIKLVCDSHPHKQTSTHSLRPLQPSNKTITYKWNLKISGIKVRRGIKVDDGVLWEYKYLLQRHRWSWKQGWNITDSFSSHAESLRTSAKIRHGTLGCETVRKPIRLSVGYFSSRCVSVYYHRQSNFGWEKAAGGEKKKTEKQESWEILHQKSDSGCSKQKAYQSGYIHSSTFSFKVCKQRQTLSRQVL